MRTAAAAAAGGAAGAAGAAAAIPPLLPHCSPASALGCAFRRNSAGFRRKLAKSHHQEKM